MFEFKIENLGDCYGVVEMTLDHAGNVLWSIIVKLCATRDAAETYIASRE